MNNKNIINKLYNKYLKIENYCYIIIVTVVFLLITYQYSQTTNLNATQSVSQAPIDVKLEEPIQIKANGDHNTYDNIEVIVPASKEIEVEEVVEVEEEVVEQEESNETLVVTATKYTAECKGCIGITKSGHDVSNTIYYENYRIVACDPNYIPLYTTMEIEGYEKQFICLDTGSAIKGFKLDILTDSYEAAIEWGRRKVEITILSYGNS